MPQLSVIVPTFNEIGNVVELRDRVAIALDGIDWEMIFVDDDSPDGTATTLREMAQSRPPRALHPARRAARPVDGLHRGHAGVVGAGGGGDRRRPPARRAAAAAHVRADRRRRSRRRRRQPLRRERRHRQLGRIARGVQPPRHPAQPPRAQGRSARPDERLLHDPPRRLRRLRQGGCLGCRLQDPARPVRHLADAAALPRAAVPVPQPPGRARASSTPTSPGSTSSCSSTSSWAAWCRSASSRSRSSAASGSSSTCSCSACSSRAVGTSFLWAQTGATMVAMTSNYVLNNVLTYRDLRLRGWGFVRGWFSFVLACSVGALANVGIADYLFQHRTASGSRRPSPACWSAPSGTTR